MATLDWIGKRAVANHHRDVPTRLLHCDGELSHGDRDTGNLLIEGDNLEALKALLPYYGGQIKCIYIDPPYNTGNEGWVYNDNLTSPEILAWLGRAVGKEAEDLSRHDKWLCMMYPRLRLLRDFLTHDGLIFVSIDDIEYARLKLVMDEIFLASGFVASFIWKSRKFLDSRSTTNVSNDHEYILAYRLSGEARLKGIERDAAKFANPDQDARGPWMSRSMLGLANAKQRPNLHYDIVDPQTGWVFPPAPDKGWRYSRERMATMVAEGRVLFPKLETGRPREKKFMNELVDQYMAIPSVIDDVHTSDGSQEIRDIFGEQVFDFPKPSSLVERLFEQVADGPMIVMDSFAGSGTSAHAALKLAARGADVRFITVEMSPDIATQITAERIKRVIDGYMPAGKASGARVEGLGGGFRYCRLGEALFDEYGAINSAVTFSDLAAHVFFCETGVPLPSRSDGSPLLGAFGTRAVYMLYDQGAAGLASDAAGNLLTAERLASLPPLPASCTTRVIYGEGCTLPEERLTEAGATFKQIPYQIEGL